MLKIPLIFLAFVQRQILIHFIIKYLISRTQPLNLQLKSTLFIYLPKNIALIIFQR